MGDAQPCPMLACAEKAAALREHAKKAAERGKERVLLMPAEDCDQLAAELEDGRRSQET
jgi:hypothetical protein